jgi:hypothetical protein
VATTVVGLFEGPSEACAAVEDLVSAGFLREDISIVSRAEEGEGAPAPDRAVDIAAGAGAGAAIGGIGGLVLGLAALAIPGIGPVVAAGPLAAALVGAGIGAAAGGIVGALAEQGIPHEEAQYYAEGIRRGGTVLLVHAATDTDAARAREIMERYGPIDLEQRAEEWRGTGSPGFARPADEFSIAQAEQQREMERADREAAAVEGAGTPGRGVRMYPGRPRAA